jgi:hypothetical protein
MLKNAAVWYAATQLYAVIVRRQRAAAGISRLDAKSIG